MQIFYSLSDVLSEFGQQGQNGVQKLLSLKSQELEISPGSFKIRIIHQIDDAIELLEHINLPQHRIEKSIDMLRNVQERVHSAMEQQNGEYFLNALGGAHVVDTISFIGDATFNQLPVDPRPIDRQSLSTQTDELLEAINQSNLEDYVRKALQLKVLAVRRVVVDSAIYTDGDLRRRVKSVFADYCAEFRIHDKNHEKLSEKMFRWARTASGVGILALSLTADTGAIAGLLSPPAG